MYLPKKVRSWRYIASQWGGGESGDMGNSPSSSLKGLACINRIIFDSAHTPQPIRGLHLQCASGVCPLHFLSCHFPGPALPPSVCSHQRSQREPLETQLITAFLCSNSPTACFLHHSQVLLPCRVAPHSGSRRQVPWW